MNIIQEKEIVLKFNVAGYDLDDIDYTDLHNSMMLHATEKLTYIALVGNFTSSITDKKVKL